MKDESKTFSIRIKKSLLDLLVKKAKNERRSLNNYINGVLIDHELPDDDKKK